MISLPAVESWIPCPNYGRGTGGPALPTNSPVWLGVSSGACAKARSVGELFRKKGEM